MIKQFSSLCVLGALSLVLFSGCLQTRSSARATEQRQVVQQQTVGLQREASISEAGSSRFSEVNEELRELRGRLEVVENRQNSGGTENERLRQSVNEQVQNSDRRLTLLQESLTKMESQQQALTAEILALKAEITALKIAPSAASASSSSSSGTQDSFRTGQEHFEKKEWKRAILAFQKYRDTSPRGKMVAEATYLMGVSFQELKMRDEARAFYEEVIAKFPKSSEARKARTRLQGLK